MSLGHFTGSAPLPCCFVVDSEHDAHALMQAEPLIKHGVRRYELKVWEVREGSLSFETKLSRVKLILS